MTSSKKEIIIVSLLLLFFLLSAFFSSLKKSPVFDEGIHIAAGYNAWVNRDFRINPENGLIPGMLGAFPLIFDKSIKFPDKDNWWQICDHWKITNSFLYQSGNDFNKMFFLARIMIIIFAVIGGIAVYFASKGIWGRTGGFIALALYSFSPTILAHSRFATSDLVASVLFFLAAWLFWRMLNRFTLLGLLIFSLAVSLLALSKMSAVLILPILLLIVGIRIIIGKKLKLNIFSYQTVIHQRLPLTGVIFLSLLFSAFFSFLVIWGAFNFRYSMLADGQGRKVIDNVWPYLLKNNNLPTKVISFTRNHRLLPEAYLLGLAYVIKNAEIRYAFLDGKYSPTGWRSFFPLTFVYKTPIPVIILFLSGIGAIVSILITAGPKPRKILMLWYISFPIAFILIYFSVAISSNLNIGHRHILPIYLPLFVIGGGASIWIKKYHFPAKIMVIAVLLFLVIENLTIYPNYLAYFSPIAGGPARGYMHLVDSSLDWGQDLKGLKDWIAKKKLPDDEVYIAYFGSVDLDAYDMPQKRLFCFFEQKRTRIFSLKGGTYCISATMLQMVFYPKYAAWNLNKEEELKKYQIQFSNIEKTAKDSKSLQKLIKEKGENHLIDICRNYELLRFAKLAAILRKRLPDEMINYTYLIYHLSDEDINTIFQSKSN